MAGIVQLPQAQNSGLANLGAVLAGAAGDYAAKKRADEMETRRRAERLSDVENDRTYADSTYTRSRLDRRIDVETDDIRKIEAEKRAEERIARHTEDQRAWDDRIRQEGLPRAQERLDQLATEEEVIRKGMVERRKLLAAAEPKVGPAEIDGAALRMARANSSDADVKSGKKPPADADIISFREAAAEKLTTELAMAWDRQRKDAQLEEQIDATLLMRIGAEKNTITNLFRRVGTPSSVPAPQQGGGAPVIDPEAARQAAAAAAVAKLKTPAPGAGGPVASRLTDTQFDYPAASVLGAGERVVDFGKRLADVPELFDRGTRAVATGIMTGDYAMPQQGWAGELGGRLDSRLGFGVDWAKEKEDEILRTQPNSPEAEEIRRRRGIKRASLIDIPTTIIPAPRTATRSLDGTPIIQIPAR